MNTVIHYLELSLPGNAIHDAPDDKGRDRGTEEGERDDGSNVAEEEALLHAVPGVEDDGREKHVEKDFGVESGFLVDLVDLFRVLGCKKAASERIFTQET
jgi:hypothetical protein